MSLVLSTIPPRLRTVARRPLGRAFYSASGHTMPAGTAPLRTILRNTTLGATSIVAQRTPYPLAQQFPPPPAFSPSRPRTPSPPPPYHARNLSLLASTTHWTRFPTPSAALASVRTFTRTRASSFASEVPDPKLAAEPRAPLSPDVQTAVDMAMEHLLDLYGTARDEYDIAAEETQKNTMYAPDDRAAARQELDHLLDYYRGVVGDGGAVAAEVRRRLDGRVRELEAAVKALEEAASHQE